MNKIQDKLNHIQQTLKVPKTQYNKFGEYYYRSCEDILNSVKPILDGCTLILSDRITEVGGRIYVEATATLWLGDSCTRARGYAREAEQRKKMDDSQITAAASSYARKLALCGLFGIDDTKDADATNKHDAQTDNTITEKQAIELKDMAEGTEGGLVRLTNYVQQKYKIESVDNLPAKHFKAVKGILKKALEEVGNA